jgi:hypothetical protein
MADEETPRPATDADWLADFAAAEERLLELSLAATPSERLRWLEEALAFAARVGALKRD